MVFKKGHRGGMTGRKLSTEHKEKIGEANKIALKNFHENNPEFKKTMNEHFKGKTSWNKGKKNIFSEKALKKMSEASKGRIPWNKGIHMWEGKEHPRGALGNKLSKETRQKMSKSRKGHKVTRATRIKISKSVKILHKNKDNYGMMGKHHSQKTKNKMSKSQIGINYIERHGEKKALELKNIIKEKRKYQITPLKDTSIEVKIQKFLKELRIEFFTHQYMKIPHGYQSDILIPSMNLVIECDGDYWHKYPIGLDKDHIRTKELIEKGFKVLRLWECEIKPMSLDDFKNKLKEVKI